jgi:hypothetical protein
MTSKSKALKKVGYKRRDSGTHRQYNFKASVKRYNKTKKFTYVGTRVGNKTVYGLGHDAGERWGDAKNIDPESKVTKYGKNSPSFSEGVYKSKAKRKALQAKE